MTTVDAEPSGVWPAYSQSTVGTTDSRIDISVVIPCLNGGDSIGAQLDSLLGQETRFTFEVIVADNGSTDDTVAVVRSYQANDVRVRIVDASRAAGINVARNSGATAARGDSIVLCDADDMVHPGWIEAFGQAFSTGSACVGGGVDRVLPGDVILSRQRELLRTNFSTVPYPLGANCGFTKKVFIEIGGFDETFAGGSDEIEFFWRAYLAGHVTQMVPDAVISYQLRLAHPDLWRQFYRYGRGNATLLRRFGTRAQMRREILFVPGRCLRALVLLLFSGSNLSRTRGGVENLGFQCGMFVEALAHTRNRSSFRVSSAKNGPSERRI